MNPDEHGLLVLIYRVRGDQWALVGRDVVWYVPDTTTTMWRSEVAT